MSLFLCHPPITRQAACGRSRRTSPSSGSSARRGGLEEARLVNLARQSSVFPVLWQAIPVMIRLQRGCWATSRRGSSRRALQVCVSCTCCSCCVWHRYMSHRDKIVDVTVGRSIARFVSEQQDCERANLDQPGHHLREKHPEWNVDILETLTRTWLFVFVVFDRCAWCT